MKGQKTNAFQLAIAGGVLVLVLICATFAWFALSDSAFVNQIKANASSPSVPDNQVNKIQYSPTGGAEATDWTDYDPSESLGFIPGQEYHFRVMYTTEDAGTVTMKLTKLTDEYREPPEETITETVSDGSEPTQEATERPTEEFVPIIGENSLTKIIQYSTGNSDNPEYSDLEITNFEAKLDTFTVEKGGLHSFYYSLYMPGGIENVEYKNYMNRELSFELSFEYQQSL